jgi:lactose/L-arabinose transport system permease protein
MSVKHIWPLIFVSPFFILFGIFALYPVGYSFYLSFQEWSGFGDMRYVGLANYRQLLRDGIFWRSLLNVIYIFLLYVPVMVIAALVVASILNAGFLKLQGMWRALIFLPYITSAVAAAFTFNLILNRQGIANQGLALLGLGPVPWLDSAWGARVSVALLLFWGGLGYNTVIVLAGLQNIPKELREAARVDGAGPNRVFWYITVPLLKPVILFVLALTTIGTFQLFSEPYILTQGGPIRATTTPIMQVFGTTFDNLEFGYAAAMSYAYFAIIVVITLVQVKLLNRQ